MNMKPNKCMQGELAAVEAMTEEGWAAYRDAKEARIAALAALLEFERQILANCHYHLHFHRKFGMGFRRRAVRSTLLNQVFSMLRVLIRENEYCGFMSLEDDGSDAYRLVQEWVFS
jgi:hypothetical protein